MENFYSFKDLCVFYFIHVSFAFCMSEHLMHAWFLRPKEGVRSTEYCL